MAPPQEPKAPADHRGRRQLQSLAMIAVFDIAGPLVAYAVLRSAGLSAVSSLVLSGIFPAAGVALKFARDHRADAIGVLVLAGIAVGTMLGLLSGNPRLVLVEGSVPTAVFGVLCLGSLWSSRPLLYRFAIEFMGPESPRGREFESYWQYREFRHIFRVMTTVWGMGFLAEAAARIVIVERTSTGVALAISKVMPYVVAGVLMAWTLGYGNWNRRRGEREAIEAAAQTISATQEMAIEAEPRAEPPPQ